MVERESKAEGEKYTWRGSAVAKEHHSVRTAANVAGFFTRHLQPGMHILDCGCGPGTITVGLAELVAPGTVTGVDVDERLLAMAQENATEAGITNVEFRSGDVYALDFADESFDAIFCHALFEHLRDPAAALKEMHRVLKPGGVIGARDIDLDSVIAAPDDSGLLRRFFDLWIHLTRENGGDTQIGKKLGNLLMAAGFREVGISGTVESYGTTAVTPFIANEVAVRNLNFLLDESSKRAYAPPDEIAAIRQALADWSQHPGSILMFTRCEAVGFK